MRVYIIFAVFHTFVCDSLVCLEWVQLVELVAKLSHSIGDNLSISLAFSKNAFYEWKTYCIGVAVQLKVTVLLVKTLKQVKTQCCQSQRPKVADQKATFMLIFSSISSPTGFCFCGQFAIFLLFFHVVPKLILIIDKALLMKFLLTKIINFSSSSLFFLFANRKKIVFVHI